MDSDAMELALMEEVPELPEEPPESLALQSVTGSPHRRVQRSRTLPIMQLAKEPHAQTMSNFQLMRVNTMHQQKLLTKKGSHASKREWLPVPELLPAGHPLLARSIDRWYHDDEENASKTSPSRFGSKSSPLRASKTLSRVGSKASVLSRAFSSVSMRDIASREKEHHRRRVQTPQIPKPVQRHQPEDDEGETKPTPRFKGDHGLVHALRDMVDAQESSGEAKKWLGQGAPLPHAVRQLDYWSAVEAFELYDTKRQGFLDKPSFYKMLRGLTRKRDYMDEKLSDRIFDEIDINQSGDIDKDEFLGWVFQTNNFRLNHLREKLVQMSQDDVKKLFKKIDKTGDGELDQEEFWHFMQAIGGIPVEASSDLHEFIDVDNSGFISFDEFLNWVHPDRELRILEKAHGKKDWVNISGYTAPEKPLMETRPGNPVVIEFWIGPDYHFMAERMKLTLGQLFAADSVRWEFKFDGRVSGTCSRVTAKVGRGIELWNRDTMMAYREDPFLDSTGNTARKWLVAVLEKCLPDVERAANLYRLKHRKHHKSESRAGSKQRR